MKISHVSLANWIVDLLWSSTVEALKLDPFKSTLELLHKIKVE